MKRHYLRKISAIAIGLICAMAMGVTAFAADTPYEDAKAYADDFAHDYYNQYTNQTISAPNGFYISVDGDVDDYPFLTDGTFRLSIGNNGFIEDDYYKEDGGDLSIAFPLILLNMAPSTDSASVTSCHSQNDSVISVNGDSGKYTVTHATVPPKKYVGFGIEGTTASDLLIVEIETRLANGNTSKSYALTDTDGPSMTGGEDYGVTAYPFGYSNTAVDQTRNGAKQTYIVYNADQGTLSKISMDLRVGGDIDAGGVAYTNESIINIEKALQVDNDNDLIETLAGPGIRFDYEIEPVEPNNGNGGATIVDEDTDEYTTVFEGPANGVELLTDHVQFSTTEAFDVGYENYKNIVAQVDLTKFTSPGVYRYKITESTNVDPDTVGVDNADDQVRYLDVFIEMDGTDKVISGYALFSAENNGREKGTFETANFETVNIELNKEVSGSMGDTTHQFPFTCTISGNNDRYFYGQKGSMPSSSAENLRSAQNFMTTLASEETYYICGLANTATVAYEETNNTDQTYTTSINIIQNSASEVGPGEKKSMAATSVADAEQVTFNNHCGSVSPTGLLLRFGPYLGMVLIGLVLVMLRRKPKETEDK